MDGGTLRQFALAAIAALALGAASSLWPHFGLLGLATLGSCALLRNPSFELRPLIGPAAAALLVGAFVGLDGAIGVLFVWRVFADARWSVAYAEKMGGRSQELWHVWTSPAHGIAMAAYTAPHMVVGLPLDLPHLPLWAPLATACVAGAALFDWGLRCAAQWRLGELDSRPAAFLAAHHSMFLMTLGFALDLSSGIVALAAWRLIHAALPQPSLTAVP